MEKQFADDCKDSRSREVNDGQDFSSSSTVEAAHAPIHPTFDPEQRNYVATEQAGTDSSDPSPSMYCPDLSNFQPGPGPATLSLSVMEHTMGADSSGSMTTDSIHPTSTSTGATGAFANISSATIGSLAASYGTLPFAAFAPSQRDIAEDLTGSPAIDRSVAIVQPQEYDILYGRGKMRRKHPGNKRMKLLVDLHRDAYIKSNRIAKTNMSKDIVKIIKSSGDKSGRFLRFDKKINGWVEVSDEIAREKISHALRDGKTKPLKRIDPKILDEIPMLSDQIKQDALRKLAASAPTGERFQSALTAEEEKQYAQTDLLDDPLLGKSDTKEEEMDKKPAAKDEDHQHGVPPEY